MLKRKTREYLSHCNKLISLMKILKRREELLKSRKYWSIYYLEKWEFYLLFTKNNMFIFVGYPLFGIRKWCGYTMQTCLFLIFLHFFYKNISRRRINDSTIFFIRTLVFIWLHVFLIKKLMKYNVLLVVWRFTLFSFFL